MARGTEPYIESSSLEAQGQDSSLLHQRLLKKQVGLFLAITTLLVADQTEVHYIHPSIMTAAPTAWRKQKRKGERNHGSKTRAGQKHAHCNIADATHAHAHAMFPSNTTSKHTVACHTSALWSGGEGGGGGEPCQYHIITKQYHTSSFPSSVSRTSEAGHMGRLRVVRRS